MQKCCDLMHRTIERIVDSPTYRMEEFLLSKISHALYLFSCIVLYENQRCKFVWMNHRKDMHDNMDVWIINICTIIPLNTESTEYCIVYIVLYHIGNTHIAWLLYGFEMCLCLCIQHTLNSFNIPQFVRSRQLSSHLNAATFQFARTFDARTMSSILLHSVPNAYFVWCMVVYGLARIFMFTTITTMAQKQ